MSESANKAVFLSYASQDAEAAQRICEALRTAGIEVWFDQRELVGGDAWDKKIRGQISACALFVPVISANTQERQEGYFRLEWHLAEQRSLLIAKGRPFIVPVSIDATNEHGALVPDAFTAVQWTKLPGGETSAAFVTRMQKFLVGPGAVTPPVATQSAAGAPARRSSPMVWVIGALGVIVLALAAFFAMRPAGKDAAPAQKPVAETKTPVAPQTASVPVANDKSIAVLPFVNRSADKDNEFFTDGIHEDILTNLCNIRALRVVSSTSVRQYRDTKKSIKEIGTELGVAYVLEGSVQRVGNKVHVTGQLVDARTDTHLWAKAFDKDLSDIFVIQAELAKAIAAELQTVLSPQEQKRIERPPTGNAAAYELYLKANALSSAVSQQNSDAIDLLKQAIALDPQFALAYSGLARRYLFQGNRTGRDDFNRALETARTAVTLDPQLALAHYALGDALGGLGRTDEARLELQRAIELDSNLAAAMHDLSNIDVEAGRLDQALYWGKRSFPLAPNLAQSYYHLSLPLRVLDQARTERWLRAGLARFPANDRTGAYRLEFMLAQLELVRGQPAAALAQMRKVVAARPTNRECQAILTELAVFMEAADARDRIDQMLADGPGAHPGFTDYTPRTLRAYLWLKSGDRERALPLIDAALEANRSAIGAGDRTYHPLYENAALHLMRGDRDAALDLLEKTYEAGLEDPAWLKMDPLLAPLANEPRFVKLVERMSRDVDEMRQRVDFHEIDEWTKVGLR